MDHKQMERMAAEHDMTGFDAEFAEKAAGAVTEGAVSGYQKIERCVVTGYKKMESGIVKGFGQVVDKCVEVLFAGKGESVEDAKVRLIAGTKARQAKIKADIERNRRP